MSNARRLRVRLHNPSTPLGELSRREAQALMAVSYRWLLTASEDATARKLIERGYIDARGTWRLTPKGDAALRRAFAADAVLRSMKANPRKARATKKKKPRARAHKGETVMAKKSKKKGRKKARSAAQKAATRRMLAANRKARGGRKTRSKGKRKSARKRPPSGAHPVSAKRRTKRKSARHTKWKKVRRSGGRSYFRRTNPSMGPIAQVLVGALIGVAVPVGATAIARRFAPEHARMIGAGAALAAAGYGVTQARKRPVLAASLVTGSVAATAAPILTAQTEKLLAPANTGAAQLAEARLAGVHMLEGLTLKHPALSGLRHTLGGVRRNLGGLAAA